MRNALKYIPSVLVAALIMYLSLLREPHFTLPTIPIPHLDKWFHGLLYFIFAATLTSDHLRFRLEQQKQSNTQSAELKRYNLRITDYIVCLLIPILYGGIIEILQENFFQPRTGEWFDWLADIIGVILGFAITIFFRNIWSRKSN